MNHQCPQICLPCKWQRVIIEPPLPGRLFLPFLNLSLIHFSLACAYLCSLLYFFHHFSKKSTYILKGADTLHEGNYEILLSQNQTKII